MGRCVSKEREPVTTGRPMDSSALVDPRGHRITVPNVYRGSSLHRHGSMGVNSPSMFHVNPSTGDFFNGLVPNPMNSRIAPRKVQAMYDYESRVEGDISFSKGDIMTLMDDTNQDWWYVVHQQHGSGYCPQNFVALIESLYVEEWFVGKIQRSLAEKLVSASGLPRGTFLVRQRDSGHEYALTINDSSHPGNFDVKHYKIRPLDANGGYYITTKKVFNSIRELIHYYSQESGGLCHRLTIPAPRVAPIRPDLSYDTQKNWEIPREEFQLMEKLGDGNFGEVWYGKFAGSVEVAIKTMKPGAMSVDAFLAEAHIMKQCNHPKLIKLYAVCTDREPLWIITEYMKNGSLLHYLRNQNNNLSVQVLVDICAQVANGMMYLETRKLVHRDLAARNVLVGDIISGVPEVKVADFGLARKLMEENIYSAQEGAKFPIKWTAPEAATKGAFTVKSDVWSYGVLLYEIFTRGYQPYPGLGNPEVIQHVQRGYRMPRPNGTPEAIYNDAMLKCWQENPEQRPTFAFLFSYFEDFYVASQPNYVPPSIDDSNR
ncbi:Tyrosine-protein kinase [Aphelenchoides besseyi]|nr:Tyrosine-protein kinase [Aphelenchoides besseyi]